VYILEAYNFIILLIVLCARRTGKRVGLIQARLLGAKAAKETISHILFICSPSVDKKTTVMQI
jgi:hypothetical protein